MMTRGACQSKHRRLKLLQLFRSLGESPHDNPMLPHFSSLELKIKKHIPYVDDIKETDPERLLYSWARK